MQGGFELSVASTHWDHPANRTSAVSAFAQNFTWFRRLPGVTNIWAQGACRL